MAQVTSAFHPLEEKTTSISKNAYGSPTVIASNPRITGWSLFYAIKVLWAFIKSDIFTFSTPGILFGITGALSNGELFDGPHSHPIDVLSRLPKVILSNVLTIVLFNFANQRSPDSVLEDSINKPWRPIPSGMITPEQTRRAALFVAPIALACNYSLGVGSEGLFMQVLTFYYNDLCGSDEIVRDGIIAVAYAVVNIMSLKLCIGPENTVSTQGMMWIAIISGIILTTMSVQDLKDQKGDKARDRKTMPLVIGDSRTRIIIACCVPFWSVLCARFWDLEMGLIYYLPLALGAVVTWRVLMKRTAEEDSKTWKLWCAWHTVVYFIPLTKLLSQH
ncbi:UbiA prenyltransferase family-domain-containing protein [Fusarium flagelliforme]|uniref:Ubia prenyltransferase n=1 Tax=Fusarium flagelliforme TaxID=2675880 RepID=A0A395MDU6_9HYPO|nr:UbiA prenyltransferase family-domain-containing protein [Fusarium flagelliforme]KAH7196396.1 UbiA prenyltransferase family-domain-containing protein [Fusarium flagelliforme]RFN45423.1 ubia prenyltransferase [Fusarium flagelliforme]